MEGNNDKRHEFSKVIFWLVWLTNLFVIVFCAIMMVMNFTKNGFVDLTILNILIPSTAAELASATGFYYWKTKTNNVYEYGEQFILDLVNHQEIDSQSVVAIAQAFFNSSQMSGINNKSTTSK